MMISTSVWLSGLTGADVWLVAGTGPNRCCWGCSPDTNTWLRTPGTTRYTCRAIIELCGSRADGAKMGFCKKERKTHKCPDLPLHFPPPDNILSPPLKPPGGISQSHFGLCVFSLLNMKIWIPPLKQAQKKKKKAPLLHPSAAERGCNEGCGSTAFHPSGGPAAAAISFFHDHLLYRHADNRWANAGMRLFPLLFRN